MTQFYQIRDIFESTHGFDIDGIYCQITGKRIGTTSADELDSLIASIGGNDVEQVVDDIAMRLLASMRPSMRWNKMRSDSLVSLLETHPEEALAYLINRMFQPLNRSKIRVDDLLGVFADRIKTYQLCVRWNGTEAAQSIGYMLLELDAKWNLITESAPFSAKDFLDDAPTMEHRIGMLQEWYARRMAAWDKKVKDDEMQSNWIRSGSPVAKPAFLQAYLNATPPSKTAVVREAKKAESDFMAGLLSEIMMGRTEETVAATAPTQVFAPVRRVATRFGVK